MRVITSFGPEGYQQYGKRFLETYLEFCDLPLTVYVESDADYPVGPEYRDYWSIPNARFCDMAEPSASYLHNINKFSRKSFAQIDALNTFVEPVLWLDADIEFTAPASFPEPNGILYMGRKGFHPCTSFVGFGLKDRYRFVAAYEDIYLSGNVFDLPEWHDAYVFDHVRQKTKVHSVDIAKAVGASGADNVFDMVFPFAHHKKGALKRA